MLPLFNSVLFPPALFWKLNGGSVKQSMTISSQNLCSSNHSHMFCPHIRFVLTPPCVRWPWLEFISIWRGPSPSKRPAQSHWLQVSPLPTSKKPTSFPAPFRRSITVLRLEDYLGPHDGWPGGLPTSEPTRRSCGQSQASSVLPPLQRRSLESPKSGPFPAELLWS